MRYRFRRLIVTIVSIGVLGFIIFQAAPDLPAASDRPAAPTGPRPNDSSVLAVDAIETLAVKGRAPKTGYDRDLFGSGWSTIGSCDTRNIILNRDLTNPMVDATCKVISGTLSDPYTEKTIEFKRGAETSDDVQIDHVVALSDSWQKGAQQLDTATRIAFANDPLELLAVDGPANMKKGDADAATWLPPNKSFRCQYVARQIAVKQKYGLWMTAAEKAAIMAVLASCPEERLPGK